MTSFIPSNRWLIDKQEFFKAKPDNLLRLARSLKLDTQGMGHRQVARLVFWRLTRNIA